LTQFADVKCHRKFISSTILINEEKRGVGKCGGILRASRALVMILNLLKDNFVKCIAATKKSCSLSAASSARKLLSCTAETTEQFSRELFGVGEKGKTITKRLSRSSVNKLNSTYLVRVEFFPHTESLWNEKSHEEVGSTLEHKLKAFFTSEKFESFFSFSFPLHENLPSPVNRSLRENIKRLLPFHPVFSEAKRKAVDKFCCTKCLHKIDFPGGKKLLS
jgi:hypothetical protein